MGYIPKAPRIPDKLVNYSWDKTPSHVQEKYLDMVDAFLASGRKFRINDINDMHGVQILHARESDNKTELMNKPSKKKIIFGENIGMYGRFDDCIKYKNVIYISTQCVIDTAHTESPNPPINSQVLECLKERGADVRWHEIFEFKTLRDIADIIYKLQRPRVNDCPEQAKSVIEYLCQNYTPDALQKMHDEFTVQFDSPFFDYQLQDQLGQKLKTCNAMKQQLRNWKPFEI